MTNKQLALPWEIKSLWLLIVGLSTLAAGICVFCKFVLHLQYPYTWPLFIPGARFTDFTIYAGRFQHFHQSLFFDESGFPFTYPAPVALVFELFYGFTPDPLDFFLGTIIVATVAAAFLFGRALSKRGISPAVVLCFTGTLTILSYPMLFLFDRANTEVAVWIFLILGVWAYVRDKGWAAAICFGIAAAMKLFPFIFIALFLAKKQYRHVVLGVLVFVAVTLFSFWLVGPTIVAAEHGVSNGLVAFKNLYALQLHPSEIGFDHSLFAIVKLGKYAMHSRDLTLSLRCYLAFSALAGTAVFFIWIRKLPRLNQVLLLTVAAILLPPVSSDYTLVHLYIPFAMLVLAVVSASKEGIKLHAAGWCFVCFAVLFTPQSYLIHHLAYISQTQHNVHFIDIGLGGMVKALALLALSVLAIRNPFPDRFLLGDQPRA